MSTTFSADWIAPIFGGDSGYSDQGGVLVNQTADGVDLNTIWDEIAQVLDLFNQERSAITQLVSHPTTAVAEPIPQALHSESFDRASEYGEPTGVREPADALLMGYDFEDYDKASRFTWKFLRDASAEQVRAVFTRVLEADNKLVTTTILDRLLNPAERANEHHHRVFGLYTGNDGITPPPYLGKAFSQSTTHYLASGAAAVDSMDIEDLITLVSEKGYGRQAGSQLLILANPQEAAAISAFRAGEESRPTEGGETSAPIAKYDFVRSASAPAYLTQDNIVGKVAPGEFHNLPVLGSYGPAWLIESEFIPAGYVAVVASGGPNSATNPVALRQHPNLAYQGLRVIPGRDQRYPLQDSFFARGFGTGIRHRGAAACLQVTTNPTYTAPELKW
ncbi:hypothetical protein [Lolliginicoccus levis]|uniref:hypothetical protein n=1 Tax=Lolliginicoccus levis TaxID=2919542 RepID=UPI00241F50DE|nr:hypothetical protein [Lolliginicoccus levis]